MFFVTADEIGLFYGIILRNSGTKKQEGKVHHG
jgi:hypothetical protein